MIGRKTKKMIMEYEELRDKTTHKDKEWIDYLDVDWFRLDELKKELITLKERENKLHIQIKGDILGYSFHSGKMIGFDWCISHLDSLCNSQEQKETENDLLGIKNSDLELSSSVSCEHNTGEDKKNGFATISKSSPVQNPKNCICPEYEHKYQLGNKICSRCGGEL